jgi:Ala-tRNA(Pro) deacylase
MSATEHTHEPRSGDLVTVHGHRVGEVGRTGEIVEVLGEAGHLHYKVRWEDGHESVFYPGNDATIRHVDRPEGHAAVSAQPVLQELARSELGYEVIHHERTETAAAEASVVGTSPETVAKTIVLVTDDGFLRAVVPASERLDLHKVQTAAGLVDRPRLATEAELVMAYPMFELGAVPPLGGPAGDRVLVDSRLAHLEQVVFEAGSHVESVRASAAALLRLTGAETADLCRE